jgi:hypothetical protein
MQSPTHQAATQASRCVGDFPSATDNPLIGRRKNQNPETGTVSAIH